MKQKTEFMRVEKTKNYSVISNEFIRRKDLSWKAKGILTYILTLPDDWVINLKEIMTHATEGESAFRSGWKELTKAGYVTREPVRDGQRIKYWETIIRENPNMTTNSLHGGFQHLDNLDVDNLDVDNRNLLSTNNTKDLIKPSTNNTNSTRHKYGDNQNVLMTKEEYDKLSERFPNDLEKRINNLGYYMASTGKTYKSHYMTIIAWDRRDKEKISAQNKPLDLNNVFDEKDNSDQWARLEERKMQAIGNLLKSNPNGMSFEEIAKETLNDPDIKEWVSDMDGVVDAGMIERGMGVLREYIKSKDNPTHRPVLQVYTNNILVTYVLRDEALVLKYRDKVPSRLVYDRTTKKYKGVELSDYETDMSNIKFFEYCKDFIDTYSYGDGSKGMWLHGKFGVGKTYLMAGLATELKKKQVGVTFVSASQLMDDMYLIIKDNQNNIQREIEKLSKAEVLIIDDLGTENPTKFMLKNVLYPIMKYRGEYKKPTFITSNLTKDQYYMQLNEGKEVIRMDIARLKEQLDVLMLELNMGGINRRDKA